MGNDGAGRVLYVPYRTVTVAIVFLPRRLGAVRCYCAGIPNPDEAVLGRWRNRRATVPIRQNTTSHPSSAAGYPIALKWP
jgi:hypothetical protein